MTKRQALAQIRKEAKLDPFETVFACYSERSRTWRLMPWPATRKHIKCYGGKPV